MGVFYSIRLISNRNNYTPWVKTLFVVGNFLVLGLNKQGLKNNTNNLRQDNIWIYKFAIKLSFLSMYSTIITTGL